MRPFILSFYSNILVSTCIPPSPHCSREANQYFASKEKLVHSVSWNIIIFLLLERSKEHKSLSCFWPQGHPGLWNHSSFLTHFLSDSSSTPSSTPSWTAELATGVNFRAWNSLCKLSPPQKPAVAPYCYKINAKFLTVEFKVLCLRHQTAFPA